MVVCNADLSRLTCLGRVQRYQRGLGCFDRVTGAGMPHVGFMTGDGWSIGCYANRMKEGQGVPPFEMRVYPTMSQLLHGY